jgi:Ca2+-binding RTX toxin-like protein
MGFRQRQCTVAVAAVLLTGAWANSAPAATVAVDGDAVVYRAGDGEANDLTVRDDFGGSTFTDAGATIEAGAGCAALPTGAVACAPGPALLTVSVGDRADSVDADTNFYAEVRVAGGTGDDTLRSGSASGRLHEVDGGSGDDTIITGVNLIGTQVDDGGPGDDAVWAQGGGFGKLTGGSGDDSLRYTQRAPGQTPELMDGGSGTDLYWWEGPDPFDDQFPARALAAGDGFDTLKIDLGPFGSGATVDIATCHHCVDRVIGSDLDDVLLGDSRTNILQGRGGNDTIDPRGGLDVVDGGTGDDTVALRDRLPDFATCGDGTDSVRADARLLDHVGKSCETVVRSAR